MINWSYQRRLCIFNTISKLLWSLSCRLNLLSITSKIRQSFRVNAVICASIWIHRMIKLHGNDNTLMRTRNVTYKLVIFVTLSKACCLVVDLTLILWCVLLMLLILLLLSIVSSLATSSNWWSVIASRFHRDVIFIIVTWNMLLLWCSYRILIRSFSTFHNMIFDVFLILLKYLL